jgi:hypothetical protein
MKTSGKGRKLTRNCWQPFRIFLAVFTWILLMLSHHMIINFSYPLYHSELVFFSWNAMVAFTDFPVLVAFPSYVLSCLSINITCVLLIVSTKLVNTYHVQYGIIAYAYCLPHHYHSFLLVRPCFVYNIPFLP